MRGYVTQTHAHVPVVRGPRGPAADPKGSHVSLAGARQRHGQGLGGGPPYLSVTFDPGTFRGTTAAFPQTWH